MGSFNPTSADLKGVPGMSKERKAAKAKGKTKQELKAQSEATPKLTKEQVLNAIAKGDMTVEQGMLALSKVGQAGLYVRANPEKGTISLYGMQRMPITLYRNQWERLLPGCDRATHPVLAFIDEYKQYLPEQKGDKTEKVPASLVGEGKPFRVPVQREEAE